MKKKKGLKEWTLNLIAEVGMKSAIKAAGSASTFGYHQPQEPKQLESKKIYYFNK